MNDLTMGSIMADPHAFGVPTFDEYCTAPDNYRKSFKRMMTEMELGPDSYRKATREIWYWVGIYKFKDQGKAVDIMQNMGWDPIHVHPDIRPTTGTAGKLIFNVHFVLKTPPGGTNEQISGLEK